MIPKAISINRRAVRSVPRSGLAPLELVMSLPLLLCVMALMVNFAHAATWKIRSAANARLAIWRHRPLWDADRDPLPVNYWPPSASMLVKPGSRVSQVDQIWNHPSIEQAWIKGPVFVAGGGFLGLRDNRVNEMSEGVSNGSARVSLRYPFLPVMGMISIHAEHTLLDSVWQFPSMGYGSNESRRAQGWWQLDNGPLWAAQRQMFLQADRRLTTNPQRELLRPLDRDPDLIAQGYPFDFYPRLTPVCDIGARIYIGLCWIGLDETLAKSVNGGARNFVDLSRRTIQVRALVRAEAIW